MPRLDVTVAALAVAAFLLPATADARRNDEPIAVWKLLADDIDQADAGPVYQELADAIASVRDVTPDPTLTFAPDVRPSEGVVVAQTTAARWLDAAWIAFQRREWTVALGLVDDALALVEPYPHARLPNGLRRDLHLARARTLLKLDETFEARESLRRGMVLDPEWEARRNWEQPEVVGLYEEIRQETIGVPPARVSVTTSVGGATILVGGVPRGETRLGEPFELLLPPGNHEITARRAGHASHIEDVFVTPRQELDLTMYLDVRNTARFQEQLAGALVAPREQRTTGVWEALDLATASIGARGVLSAHYDGLSRELNVGLYLPGRQGWAFYRSIELGGVDERARIDAAVEDMVVALDTALHPTVEALEVR